MCAPSTGLISSDPDLPDRQQVLDAPHELTRALGRPRMQDSRPLIRNVLCDQFAQPPERPAARAHPFGRRFAVVHLEDRLHLQQVPQGGDRPVHAAAAAHVLQRVQRRAHVGAADLPVQQIQDLRQRATLLARLWPPASTSKPVPRLSWRESKASDFGRLRVRRGLACALDGQAELL